jgi:DNA-binding NtrC family response regulator
LVNPQKKSILIVEDDESMLEYCTSVLSLDGHEVTAVASGTMALAQLSARGFDLVLTDHVQIGAGGRSMTQIVKASRPASKVIVMSGMPSTENAVVSYLEGASNYLSKPFSLDELRAAVTGCFSAKAV